jgi:hypothetical protein
MSGGHFNYDQHRIGLIADSIENMVIHNERTDVDHWGDPIGYNFSPETIAVFAKAVKLLREAQTYAQRIDWLVSGDDGEDSFHKRLADDLRGIEDEVSN